MLGLPQWQAHDTTDWPWWPVTVARRRPSGFSAERSRLIIRSLSLRLRPAEEEVPRARQAITTVLGLWDCPREHIEDMELLTSELVGNAVLHGPRTPIHVVLQHRGSATLLKVTDGSYARPSVCESAADEEHHRGLFLVEAISSKWGWRRNPCGTKTIWCALFYPVARRPVISDLLRGGCPDCNACTA